MVNVFICSFSFGGGGVLDQTKQQWGEGEGDLEPGQGEHWHQGEAASAPRVPGDNTGQHSAMSSIETFNRIPNTE